MKNRLLSLLAALALLAGLLPVDLVPAGATGAAQIFHAYGSPSAITMDGAIKETVWALTDTAGASTFGFLLRSGTLYIGLRTGELSASFTVNGVKLTADLEAGTVNRGTLAVSAAGGTAEISVPLNILGLTGQAGETCPITCAIGPDSVSGQLVLYEHTVVLADDFDDISVKSYASKLNTPESEVFARQAEGALQLCSGTLTSAGASLSQPYWALASSNFDGSQGFQIELTADFNDLLIPGASAVNRPLCGPSVDVRGEDWQLRWGFHTDASGSVLLTQYEATAASVVTLDTGLDLPAKNARVRFEVSAAHDTAVFINDVQIGSFAASARKPSASTKNRIYLYNTTLYRSGDGHGVDVALYDLRMLQAGPAPTLEAALLGSGLAVTADGLLDEGAWDLNTTLGTTVLGALRDTSKLYFALRSQETSVTLTVAGKDYVCALGSSPSVTGSGASIAGGGGVYELALPLSVLSGQTEADFILRAGSREKRYTLTLSDVTLTASDLTRSYSAEQDDGTRAATAFLRLDGLMLDGAVAEDQWYLPLRAAARSGSHAPCAGLGFLWDGAYLYLGADVFDVNRLRAVTVTVNGRAVTADLASNTTDAGALTCGRQQLEWAIPLTALGLDGSLDETAACDVALTSAGGTSGIHGQLTLSGACVVLGDSCDDPVLRPYAAGSSPSRITWSHGDGQYSLVTSSLLGTGNQQLLLYHPIDPVADDASAPFSFTVDLTVTSLPNYDGMLGKRGLSFDLRLTGLQARFNLRSDNSGNVLLDVLSGAPLSGDTYCVTCDTTVNVGQRAVMTFDADETRTLRLYVNGRFVAELPKLDRFQYAEDDMPDPRLGIYAINYNRAKVGGTLYGVSAVIHDVLWTRTERVSAEGCLRTALEGLDTRAILNGNVAARALTGPLALPTTLTDPLLARTYDVVWTATDPVTGQAVTALNVATGAITAGKAASRIDLTAAVSADGVSARRTFSVEIPGTDPGGRVALIENDDDPRTGRAGSFTADAWVTLDTGHNSVVFDQGSVKHFDRVVLTDSDAFSRVSRNDLAVFVSNDNVTYTKLSDFLLHQSGGVYTLYDLDAEARYVKVHCYLDELDTATYTTYDDPLRDTQPSFLQRLQAILAVADGPYLPGASGPFAHSASVSVPNARGTEARDEPVYLPLSGLPARAGEYRASLSDFRFLQDGRVLAHYYDGEGGFWVRVPTLPAGGTQLTVCWGCPSAENYSDATAVFEAVYGNVSLINLSLSTDLANSGRAFTFPRSGDVIAVAKNAGGDLVMSRSADGGRTFQARSTILIPKSKYGRGWGFGSFLYDEELNRLYLIAYSGKGYQDGSLADSELRLALMYTEDDGRTWSKERFLTDASLAPMGEDDYILQNSQGRRYMVTYCDGLKLKDADGAGPNVDYVIMHGFLLAEGGVFAAGAVFSADGGESWTASSDCISMEVEVGHEAGISETGLAQLADGRLYVVARAQSDENYYLYEAFSDDCGNTWYNIGPSSVISTNTSPVLATNQGERLLLWAGNNSLGGNARRRLPMTIAVSEDEYASYSRSLDLTLGTTFDTLIDAEDRMTQPSLSFSPDGSEAFVCWTNLRMRDTVGFLVEEFDRMLHDTRGAFDDFEATSLKHEGWLRDFEYNVVVSEEQASSGRRSMKLTDTLSTGNLYALRQIPSMQTGTVGMSLYVPSSNSDIFTVELKSGYNFTGMRHTIAAFTVAPSGTVSIRSDSGLTAVGKVQPDRWNAFSLFFDIEVGQGRLTVNGEMLGSFALMDKGDRITVVQVGTSAATAGYGSCLYVDDFYAIERQEAHLALAPAPIDDIVLPTAVPGDLTGDDKVNGKDVVLLQRFVAGGYGLELDAALADVNGDGKVNGKDVVLLQRFVAGGYNVEL